MQHHLAFICIFFPLCGMQQPSNYLHSLEAESSIVYANSHQIAEEINTNKTAFTCQWLMNSKHLALGLFTYHPELFTAFEGSYTIYEQNTLKAYSQNLTQDLSVTSLNNELCIIQTDETSDDEFETLTCVYSKNLQHTKRHAISYHGKYVAIESQRGTISITNTATKQKKAIVLSDEILCFTFDNEGKKLIVSTSINGIIIIDAFTGTIIDSYIISGEQNITRIFFTAENDIIARSSHHDNEYLIPLVSLEKVWFKQPSNETNNDLVVLMDTIKKNMRTPNAKAKLLHAFIKKISTTNPI